MEETYQYDYISQLDHGLQFGNMLDSSTFAQDEKIFFFQSYFCVDDIINVFKEEHESKILIINDEDFLVTHYQIHWVLI